MLVGRLTFRFMIGPVCRRRYLTPLRAGSVREFQVSTRCTVVLRDATIALGRVASAFNEVLNSVADLEARVSAGLRPSELAKSTHTQIR